METWVLSAGCVERKGKSKYAAWVGGRGTWEGETSCLCIPSGWRGAALKPQDAPAAFLKVSRWAAESLHRAKAQD